MMIDDRLRVAAEGLRREIATTVAPPLPTHSRRPGLVVLAALIVVAGGVGAFAAWPTTKQSVSGQIPTSQPSNDPSVTGSDTGGTNPPGSYTTSDSTEHPDPVAKTTLSRTLLQGTSGDDVKQVQTRLTELGFVPGVINGTFGEQTREAVWAYEKLILQTPSSKATGKVTNEMWQGMQDPVVVQPRRPGAGTHVEIYLPQQVLAVFTDNKASLVIHISSGTAMTSERTNENSWCETVPIDTDDNGNPLDPPQEQAVCGVAYTPGGVFHIQHAVTGDRVGALGRMFNPIYFNYGIAIHGSKNVPLRPASHGTIRINQTTSDTFQNYVHLQDVVYVWGEDGKQPEDYTKIESTPVFNYPDPNTPVTDTVTSSPDTNTATGTPSFAYRVNDGDSLISIAANNGVTVDGIIEVNGWPDGIKHVLHLDDLIFVPSTSTVTPLLTGLTEPVAVRVATERGFTTTITYQDVPYASPNEGRVLTQTPPVSQGIPSGSNLQLVIGRALPTPTTIS